MEPRTFLDALHHAAGDYLLATVLEGEAPGAQLLLRGGVPLWPEHPAPCLSGRLSALRQITSSGVQELEGLRVFAERFGAAPRLVVCGGGHVGASVVRLARLLGLPVCALEDRPDFADDLRDAGAEEVLCAPFSESLAKISGGAECYFVVVTRAHNCDLECLTAILQKPAAYVGMMGSRGRTALVRRQLTEAGLDPAQVEALHAPIGLAIGAKTAEEIALSILAEIVQIKSARPLTEGFSPAILAALGALDTPAVLATIVSRHGSTPREVGSKMLLLPDGRTVGSVGGGIMEYRVQQLAAKMLAGEEPPTKLAAFTTDGTGEDAAIAACGGSMSVLLQRMEPEENSDEAWCAAAATSPPAPSTGCGRRGCGCWYWKPNTPPPSAAKSPSAKQSTRAKRPWKVCGPCGRHRWPRRRPSGPRTPCPSSWTRRGPVCQKQSPPC